MANSRNSKNASPIPRNPSPGNVNSVFFTGGQGSNNPSQSPKQYKPNISITIDPAEDNFGFSDGPKSPSYKSREDHNKGEDSKGRGTSRKSRKDRYALSQEQSRFQRKYIVRSYEYDRELIKRQQAMIAFQPMTGLEEIDYKRDLLRMKVENRKIEDAIASPRSRAITTLGTLTASKSQPGSRSPSPSRLSMDKDNSEYHISKKLADSTSQAIKVTKKVSGINKKLTPKINNMKPMVSKK